MVVDHPDGLHVRIDDRRTGEGEATAPQIVAHGVGWALRAGISPTARQRFWIGRPSTKRHWYALKLPNSACTSRNAWAFLIADSILARLRTIPASASSAATFRLS